MTDDIIERYPYDVVVIGAGGSGLRAAIEARLRGRKTAIISKSLLGKAHTVMAEGGCAAARGNVDPNDNWQVHFRDTMRGGKFLNNPDTGRFAYFEAPAVVLATGGIGRAFKVTSNSWEYTGDGHARALLSGATLLNMEFVQFHPTHMVSPPPVAGLVVTESVRGDGGVLRNSPDLRNVLLIAGCVAHVALERQESRGGRTRDDYPGMSPEWRRVNPVCSLDGDRVTLRHQPVPAMRPDLQALFDRAELRKYTTQNDLTWLPAAAEAGQ